MLETNPAEPEGALQRMGFESIRSPGKSLPNPVGRHPSEGISLDSRVGAMSLDLKK